ncbi:MAG: MmgE/PrpD family protein [Betaproteobacteria bacterium]|nr:MmgE/PrpD family protein [Betaproteobacteria bacterium]MDH3436879.1 MmgE/PrpD family protein [Betaproteobacteria bacterium]
MSDRSASSDNAPEVSRALAEYVAGIQFQRLPSAAVHAFRRALLDYVTCAVSGSRMGPTLQVLDYLRSWDRSGEACVVGSQARLACPNAAFVNGTSTHGLDFDDGYTQGSVHPAGAIFPALLAMAERLGANIEEVIAAGVAAYDVTLRIAASVHPDSARRGFHNTPTAGVFGAAAAVSRLLGLDARRTLDALGLAGSFAGGLREYVAEGADVKRIHPGKAARDGIVCAELALRGLSGPTRVLEGRYGFAQAVSGGNADLSRVTAGLGRTFEICGTYFKPYPACRHFHSALDAIRIISKRRAFAPQEVESVEIGLYDVGVQGHDHKHAYGLLDAQMSAPVSTALAVVLGDVTATSYDRSHLDSPEVKRIADATTVVVDAECERLYPRRRSGVARVHFKDGTKLEERVLDPKGEGENPMTDDDLTHKFMSNCRPILGEQKCARVLQTIWSRERSAELKELYRW